MLDFMYRSEMSILQLNSMNADRILSTVTGGTITGALAV